MTDALILHHYDLSPYAEKIRLMFGHTRTTWHSLRHPVWPPRKNLDPLTGGYRRIPVAQLGADIFCDTAVIAAEVARLTNTPSLDPARATGNAAALMERAEKQVFFATIGAVDPRKLLFTLVKSFGPVGAYKFAKDRAKIGRGGNLRAPRGGKAKAIVESFFDDLSEHLAGNDWVGGDAPTVADFACYHPLWLAINFGGPSLGGGARVASWFKRVAAIGHGERVEVRPRDAFEAAREAEPRALPDSVGGTPVAPGAAVKVAPEDYGVVAVSGTLAAMTADRIIVAREAKGVGPVHVHFPRAGYSITAG